MLGNRRGDMGFGEAVISMIAVVIVLNALIFAVVSYDTGSDHEGPDFRMLDGHVSEGRYVLDSEEYLQAYFERHGFSGLCLKVSIPTSTEDYIISIGSDTGYNAIHSGTGLVRSDSGAVLPAVYKVFVC